MKLFLIALSGLLLLGACSKQIDNAQLRVDVIEDLPRPFAIAAMPLRDGSSYLRMATAQGLVGFDRSGNIVPALAIRWIVTEDGLSYIFRLNKIRWNDNRELTSSEVAIALNARFAELRNSRLGPELEGIDRVVSMTGKVIELRLKTPMPNILETLAQPELGLVVNGAGSGPMLARKSGTSMQLNMRLIDPRGKPILAEDRLVLTVSPAAAALARFGRGETDLITGGRFEHLPFATATDFQGGTISIDPAPGLFGLLVVRAGPFLSDVRNREAIAMAIDRPKLLSAFEQVVWQENVALMPETLTNRAPLARPEWAAQRIAGRKSNARNQISDWKLRNGEVRTIKILVPKGPGARILFARLRSDFAAIGLDIERAINNDDADFLLIDRVATQSSPTWYLTQLSCNASVVCDSQADALVEAARQATQPNERMEYLRLAEEKLQLRRNYIPISNPLRWSVARTGLLGFAPNPRAWHPLQQLGNGPRLGKE
jgi:ABC-type transport system substrate-binding protein